MTDVDERIAHGECVANGVRLHYVEAGPADGSLVVLLHGFPEYWYSWRYQIGPLADAGFRVVALDMRGYNRSEKPRGVAAYRLERLAGDVAGLLAALDRQTTGGTSLPASVVGHDWGGMVAWTLATVRPDAVERIAVLNAPHPVEFARELGLEQALRSFYGLCFQVPRLPEAVLAAGGERALEAMFRAGTTRPGAFTGADVGRFRRALARDGALRSALHYYRAFFRGTFRENVPGAVPAVGSRLVDPVSPVEVPALMLWGERDPALARERTTGLEDYVSDLHLERYPDASHWIHADAPDRVTEHLTEFLGDGSEG